MLRHIYELQCAVFTKRNVVQSENGVILHLYVPPHRGHLSVATSPSRYGQVQLYVDHLQQSNGCLNCFSRETKTKACFICVQNCGSFVGRESSGVSYATATWMLRRRLGKGHEKVGINMSTMCYSVGKKLLNNLSAVVMKSGKRSIYNLSFL